MQEGWEGLKRPVFVIDGSTLRLQHEPELVKTFSPGHNQHGENHGPVMQLVVFHDVFSGLALRPSWGAMYGDQAVSEQALAEQALERLRQRESYWAMAILGFSLLHIRCNKANAR